MIASLQVQSGVEIALLPHISGGSLGQYVLVCPMHCLDCSLSILAHSLLHSLLEVTVELQGLNYAAPGLQSLRSIADRRSAIAEHLGLSLRIP